MKNKTKKISWDLLPLLMVTAALPLIAMGRKVSVSLGKYSWFADGNYQYDFFMYAKSIVFLILVAWMLIVLIDRGLIQRHKTETLEIIYTALYIWTHGPDLHGIFCGQGAFPERHVAAV